MGLDKLNKQQKIFLFFVVPAMLVMVAIFANLLFSDKKEKEEVQEGINTQLPSVANNIQGEKVSAYQSEEKHTQRNKSDFVLGDYEVLNDNTSETINEINNNQVEKKKEEDLPPKNTKKDKREERVQEVRRQLSDDREAMQEFDDDDIYDAEAVEKKRRKDRKAEISVSSSHQKVGFNSITLNKNTKNPSSGESKSGGIAFVHGEQTVWHGKNVKIRTGEIIKLQNGKQIPANTFLYGTCNLSGERVQIKITSYNYNLVAYGVDGYTGINVQGSVQKEENKKAGSKGLKKVGSVLGSGVNIATGGILGGLAETATESVIDAVADGSSKSVQQKKVILPNNEPFYLK